MRHRLFWAVGITVASCASLLLPSAARAEEKQDKNLPVCVECHEDVVKGMALTKHGAKLDSTGAVCQSCHGDVAAHLADPAAAKPTRVFNNKSMLASEKSAVCLTCHDGQRQLAFWDAGKHKKNDVSCVDCHAVHAKRGEPTTAPYLTTQRKLQYEVCGNCHKNVRTQLNKNSHHPILEGKVACSDCHNPHGALSHAMVKNESITQLCTSCHADKRGPFVFAHLPVEENCLTCHNSHGSNVPKLLTVKAPQLCQDCHGSAHGQIAYGSSFGIGGANQDRATRFDARACVNCHQMIHGSNAPASRGQFFLR